MPSNTHLLDIDRPTWDEYIAWADDIFSPDFFVEYWEETDFEKLYSQLEFPEYGKNLCTAYNGITCFSIIMKREWTREERLEIVKRRSASWDFDPSVGGFTSIGVDVVRRYYNELYPSDPIRTAMVSDMKLLRKLAQKNIPIMTSLRGNRQFTLDQVDGVMDKLDYWNYPWARYGHARTRRKLEVLDNYLKKYRYKTIDDLELCMNNAFESKNVFIAFKESSLSEKGKRYLQGMKDGLWNGERAGSNISRYEASRMAIRLNTLVPEKTIWNGKDGQKEASIYEVTLMLSKVSAIPVYLGADRNKTISRWDTIELIYMSKTV